MNKKILGCSLILGTLLSSLCISAKGTFGVYAQSDVDTETVQALSHCHGTTVSFINADMKAYWDGPATDFDSLKNLYENNNDIAGFANYLSDPATIRSIYSTWDDFKPTNNTLRWKSKVDATSYDLVVSLNDELTEVVYEAKNLKEAEYTMVNPLRNQHYFWQVTAHARNEQTYKSTLFDFYSGDYTRTVDIEGVSNTRDLGGITTKYGTFQQGLVYRGGRLDDITKNGKKTLADELKVKTDLDIREDGEGAKNPARLTNYYLKTLKNYFQAIDKQNRENTIEAVRVFANKDNYPVFYHCAVGRDRTGTLGIILLGLFGAPEEYIVHEYYNSVFSVSGAYQKELANLNYDMVKLTMDSIKSYGGSSFSECVENFLKVDNESGVGLTDIEIQNIRKIFAGEIEVSGLPETKVASENYLGKSFVTFKSVGQKDVVKIVNKGSLVSVPYALDDDYTWYLNGNVWDSSEAIQNSLTIYADIKNNYVVTLHFVGIDMNDKRINAKEGDVIKLKDYNKTGYTMTAISDVGKQVSKITVTRNIAINILYSKK